MKIQKKYQGAIPLNRIANEHNESEINAYSTKYMNEKLEDLEKEIYPVGSVIYNNNNINPASYLGYGKWELTRTFYGGELLGYGIASITDSGTQQTAGTNYAFSDTSVGPKEYNVVSYVPDIITGGAGALNIRPQGIVGLVDVSMTISGLGTDGLRGFWWSPWNWNTLPEGVTVLGSGGIQSRGNLLTGPIDANYGGNTNHFLYKVDDGVTEPFFINPEYSPYNGNFTPGLGGVGCKLQAKVFAKAGTNYMWTRVSDIITSAEEALSYAAEKLGGEDNISSGYGLRSYGPNIETSPEGHDCYICCIRDVNTLNNEVWIYVYVDKEKGIAFDSEGYNDFVYIRDTSLIDTSVVHITG